jgi:c-di-GMP-binding flagellar brake protein YcgR
VNSEKTPIFHLNEEVFVEPTAGSRGFHTQIIGLKPHRCLILEHPFNGPEVQALKASDAIWVRCFQETVSRFKTQILGILEDPLPCLFVSYPEVFEEYNLRASSRKKIFLRGRFIDSQHGHPDPSNEGYILDISDSGCLMWGDFVHLVDKEILLSFRVPWTGERIDAKARVVRCEVTEKGIRSGLQFVDLDLEAQEHLRKFISSLKDEEIHHLIKSP